MSLTTTALRTAGTQDLSRLAGCAGAPRARDEKRERTRTVGESVVRARDLIDPHRHR